MSRMVTQFEWPYKVLIGLLVFLVSHSLIVPSSEHVANTWQSKNLQKELFLTIEVAFF